MTPPRLNSFTRAALTGALVMGALAATAFAGQAPDRSDEMSVIPDAGAPAQPRTSGVILRPRITRLLLGRAPHPLHPKSQLVKSFVTDSPTELSLIAEAALPPGAEGARIHWRITPPAGFQAPESLPSGRTLKVRLRRPEGNPEGLGNPLSVTVTASLVGDGASGETSAAVQQDLRDRLRQEYIDLARDSVPARSEFLDAAEFARRFGKKYPAITFNEFNFSVIPSSEERYPVVLANEELLAVLHRTRKTYGRPLVFTSGFRNPVRQNVVHESVQESHHQYGRAADLYVPVDRARGIATEANWLRLAASAARSGSVWIEPMLSCNVNTAGCHVHLDVGSGRRSGVVTFRGTVVDTRGLPVEGALVQVAGMPARTRPDGKFSLKQVVTLGRSYEARVQAEGRGEVTTPVAASTGGAPLRLVLAPDPLPTLVASAPAVATPDASAVSVPVTLRNVGLSGAASLEFSPVWPGAAAAVRSGAVRLASLGPGQSATFPVVVKLPAGSLTSRKSFRLPLRIAARFTTPQGTTRQQNLAASSNLTLKQAAAGSEKPGPPAAESAAAPKPEAAPPSGEPVAAAGGLLIGGAAAAARALKRKAEAKAGAKTEAKAEPKTADPTRPQPAPEPEASVLPAPGG